MVRDKVKENVNAQPTRHVRAGKEKQRDHDQVAEEVDEDEEWEEEEEQQEEVVINVLMVGDPRVGKTALLRSLVGDELQEEYQPTTEVLSYQHTISLTPTLHLHFNLIEAPSVSLTPELLSRCPVILFLFDLTRKSTLNSIKTWYRRCRPPKEERRRSARLSHRSNGVEAGARSGAEERPEGRGTGVLHLLVGTKYDVWAAGKPSQAERERWLDLVRQFSQAMLAPVLFTSSSTTAAAATEPEGGWEAHPSNIFRVMISKLFDVQCTIPECTDLQRPIILYEGLER
ncbi:P-loop containing nucleoside triphosphate hydrolase protein [Microstroma glucosiphilum]|uniref:P-loop containing nucleoside triphosphate hydrolase protein n=1 Tax=Pseudomicrostroma glucosiphilum TaxID=1684307 RepID=A0A316UF47_9BASI|nr:P-loop containing nucleoside triphosphate hydrolase protein [Pseudomicrostroma glucosiphilum]PWN23558.1 P-loop containing nucleoside triphosphate hydrolase protein [Pseudomicrostroma glucosiphilum]